jgi:hypothetical protein
MPRPADRPRRVPLLISVFHLLLPLTACRNSAPAASQPAEPSAAPSAAPLYQQSEAQIDRFLRNLAAREPDLRRRVVVIARGFVGQPYKLGVLGEGGREPYDPDPLYCLTASDCVTFVEQTYALALSPAWSDFLPTLHRIRYRNGEVGILTRNHFTEADWNVNNAWLFDDITNKLAGGRASVPLRQRIRRAAFFRKLGVPSDVRDEDFVGNYVPRSRLDAVLEELQDADVAEIVRGTRTAPYVAHMGLIARRADGRVMLIHSGAPAVRELLLSEYLAAHPGVIGMKFLRPRAGTNAPRSE